MPSRWTRRVTRPAQPLTRGKSARQSNKPQNARLIHILNTESRLPGKGGKNSGSKNQVKAPPHVTSVPISVPNTGIPPIPPGSPLLGAIENTATSGLIIPSTSTPPFLFSKAPPRSFSALPPLPSLIATGSPSILAQTWIPGSSSHSKPVETNPPTTPSLNTQAASKAHALNLAVIILLAVGSALLLMGSCILIKICTRPKRQIRPKPSLPIFEDADPEDDFFESKESPIFGGKERLSPMPDPGGPAWHWVPYPHTNNTQTPGIPNDTSGDRLAPGSYSGHTEYNQIPLDATASEAPPTVPAASYAPKRQSIGAASMYSRSHANVGQAITHDGHETALATDEDDLLTRSRTKISHKRRSHLGRDEKLRNRESSASTVGLAYDCDDVGSPATLEYTPMDKAPPAGYFEGRERIKSGYFATGTYPRVSTMPSATYSIATATRVNVGQRTSLAKEKFPNATSKRQRDTQALTYALGLATPDTNSIAHSPQPTLYPDDSMSIADTKRQKRRHQVESVPDIPVIVPEQSTARNGLMSMDFRVSQMSLSELTMGSSQEDDGGSTQDIDHRNQYKREPAQNIDMPPRVPSPPPLPSLAQMALSQHNPEEYANYRSPTYSLYGLYENPIR